MSSLFEVAGGWKPAIPNSALKDSSAAGLNNLLYVVLCCLSTIPFVAVHHPPIVDFANHAARLGIACHPDAAAFAAMYKYQLGIIPNLAVDLVNLPLCGMVDPGVVLKLVTAASLGVIYVSGWAIQRRLFGETNAFLLMLPAMAFNLATTMGYINFLAGIAVTMAMVAVAIRREHEFPAMLGICNVGGLAIFFCHIFAVAVAILIFFGLNLRQKPVSVKAVVEAAWRTGLQFLLPLALLIFVPSGGHQLAIEYEGKVRALVALFMAQQASVGVYGILLAIPLYLLIRSRMVELDRRLHAPLVVLAIYVLLVPSQISDAVDIDSRSFVALAYLLFVALRPLKNVRQISLAVASISGLFVILQIWTMLTVWQPFSDQMDEFRSSLDSLPSAARVFPVTDDQPGPGLLALPMAYTHVTSYATTERGIFNPLEFTGVGMQPMSVLPAFAQLDTPAGLPFSAAAARKLAWPSKLTIERAHEFNSDYALRWPQKFDYVIYFHFGREPNFDPSDLQQVHSGSFFSILKVKRPARPARTQIRSPA